MKRKFMMSSWSRKAIGSIQILFAVALVLSLTACDDSGSGPSNDDLNNLSSEAVTSSETTGDSTDRKSSDSNGNSAPSQNDTSSASQSGNSSAEVGRSSSSFNMPTCSHITDNECRVSQGCSLTPCMNGTKVMDCITNSEYVCNGGVWTVVIESSSSVTPSSSSSSAEKKCFDFENMCPVCNDGALCPVTNRACDACDVEGEIAFDCTTNKRYVCTENRWQNSCANILGVEGYDRWNCNEEDFTLTTDCNDNTITYMCVSNHWFKTEDRDPTKPNCGFDNYKLCRETRLKKFCVDSAWVEEPCDPEVHGFERTLYTYDDPDNPEETSFTQMRYFCENGEWISEKNSYQCAPMMDCGNGTDKSDDHGILPDNAPCDEEGAKMIVEGYTFQCISKTWTRL